jgi:ABC-2 type transport system ATP-binding protein
MSAVVSPPALRIEKEKRVSISAEAAVRLQAVTKSYGAVRAVNGIALEIRRGETVALLGPNGAGKTTTITMLLGLLKPTSGSVEIFGRAPDAAARQSRVGAMMQEGKLLPGVKVGELLDFVRRLHPAPLPKDKLIELADLDGLEKRRVDRLSGGQTQRVRFALAIAGNPDLLVLDEPTSALDVEARRQFWASMHAYAEEGHTVLFATHYLEEAQDFASRLVIIAQGRIIADGTVPEIQARYGQTQVFFTLEQEGAGGFDHLPGVQQSEVMGERVTLHTRDVDATVRALVNSTLPWKEIDIKTNDLEDIFISLVHQGQGANE